MNEQRLVMDAAIDPSVIRGTLTAATGEHREFRGWLELNAAFEAMLQTSSAPESQDLLKQELEQP